MPVYVLSANNSDLSGGADFNKQLVLTPATAGTLSVTIAGATSETSYGFTNAGNTLGYDSTSATPYIFVVTANSNISVTTSISRVNSAGVVQATSTVSSSVSLGTTGVKITTNSSWNVGTFASTDRLRVNYIFTNSAMNNQTVVIQTGTVNTGGDIPFYLEQSALYWVGATGTWSSSATVGTAQYWALTSGGAGGVSIPASNTDVFFDANSDAGSPFTVTLGSTASCKNLTISGLDQTMTLAGTTPAFNIYGNVSLPSTNFSMTYSGAFYFSAASGTQTLSASGATFSCDVVKDFFPSTLQLLSNVTITPTKTFYFNQGTLDLNTNILSTGAIASSQVTTRSILFGTSKIQLSGGNSVTIWNFFTANNFTYTGTPTVEVTGSATTTRSIQHGINGGSSANAVSISATAGSGQLFFQGYFLNISASSGFAGYYTFSTTYGNPIIYGDFTLGTAMTNATAGTLSFEKGSGTQTITTNSKSVDILNIIINTPTGTVELNGNLQTALGTITLTQGTFDAKTFYVALAKATSSGTLSRGLNLGSQYWQLQSAGTIWDFSNTAGLTFNKGTAYIELTSTGTGARTFAGGGLTYNDFLIGGSTGSSSVIITGSNTFATVSSSKTVAHTITLESGSTTTVSDWTVQGASGKVVTLNASTAGSAANLVKTGGGTISVNYYNIKDSNASPSNTWYALISNGNTDSGNNTGWIFSLNNGSFLQFFN